MLLAETLLQRTTVQAADLFRQLVDMLAFYMAFPIDDHTGEPLAEDDVIANQYEKVPGHSPGNT